jgi:thiol-disulfide isomerase/thioredoxin
MTQDLAAGLPVVSGPAARTLWVSRPPFPEGITMPIIPRGRSRRRWVIGLAVAGVLGLVPATPAPAQDTRTKASRRDDPAARSLLEQVAKAYRDLSSYADQGQLVIAMTLGGKDHKQVRPLKLTFVRPNKLDLDAGAVRLISDGKTLTTVEEPWKKYMTAPAPATIGLDTFREGPAGAVLFGGPTAAPMVVLLSLLSGANPDVLVDQMGGTIQPAPAAAVPHAGQPEKAAKPDNSSLVIDLGEGPDLLLRIDPATKLLAAIELKIDPAQLARSAPPGQTLSIEQFGWTAGAISTQVAKDRSFAFEAPHGFSQVESLKDQPGGGPAPRHAVEEKLGKPAPEFSLTLLDGPEKTRTVTKAELAGQVVLIDFWATWCGPCLMELPEIQTLIKHYATAKKDVLIVALSQDSRPDELSEVRKLVEKTLRDKSIMLTGNPVGRIGLDPSNSVGNAFDVEGYPTLVILDAKGIVQSAHVGSNPDPAEPLHQSLAKEIDALLEGKSLVPAADPTHKDEKRAGP